MKNVVKRGIGCQKNQQQQLQQQVWKYFFIGSKIRFLLFTPKTSGVFQVCITLCTAFN